MSPYAQGNIAAAQREIGCCVDAIKAALKDTSPDAWRHVGKALAHAHTAQAQLADAMELESIMQEAGE